MKALRRFFCGKNSTLLWFIFLFKIYQKWRFEKKIILLGIKMFFMPLFIYFCHQNKPKGGESITTVSRKESYKSTFFKHNNNPKTEGRHVKKTRHYQLRQIND